MSLIWFWLRESDESFVSALSGLISLI